MKSLQNQLRSETADYNALSQPLHKYVIREKTLHHRHFLKYDTSRNQVHEYCQEKGCRYRKQENSRNLWNNDLQNRTSEYHDNRRMGKENSYPNYYRKYETKYPPNLLDTQESPEKNSSLKYILKPILYSRIDEYFVENEKEEAQKRMQKHHDVKAKAEIIKNFQELYESHCRLIEAQNVFIHEHMELVRARQLLQVNNEKARWLETHAQVFSTRQNRLSKAQLMKNHRKSEVQALKNVKKGECEQKEKGVGPIFRQYVSSL